MGRTKLLIAAIAVALLAAPAQARKPQALGMNPQPFCIVFAPVFKKRCLR